MKLKGEKLCPINGTVRRRRTITPVIMVITGDGNDGYYRGLYSTPAVKANQRRCLKIGEMMTRKEDRHSADIRYIFLNIYLISA